MRTVKYFKVSREGNLVTVTVAADGFLYNMVRIMVGTMLQYGQGRNMDGIARALETGRRDFAGPTAPAHGLTLARVEYENFDTKEHVR